MFMMPIELLNGIGIKRQMLNCGIIAYDKMDPYERLQDQATV